MIFTKEKRTAIKEDNPEIHAKEITTLLSQAWKECKNDPKKHKKWTDMAAEDKVRFDNEKEGWVDNESDKDESFAPDPEKKSKSSTKKSKTSTKKSKSSTKKSKSSTKKSKSSTKKSKSSTKKSKSSTSGFLHFCQLTREGIRQANDEWTNTKVSNEMNRLWGTMDDEEKAEYSQLNM
jgi:hypothetical protein